MKSDRVKNSVYNSFSNLAVNISVTILSFIVRTIFIKQLGEQCLGLDGLFTNILSLLSLTELGFSSAISFSLYEPLAKNKTEQISKLMHYFKNVYKIIAVIVLIVGLCLLPFLNKIVKDYTISENIYIIYILYLLNTVSTYLISYSSILIEADQKNYKLTFIRLLFNIITYGFQIIIILLTQNFILYLAIQFLFRLIERIIVNEYIKRKYKMIDFNINKKIDNEDKELIRKNIKGIIFHRFGDYAVNGTDNILISSIVNISTTGIYSNYLSIISILRNLIGSVILATTSSFGNLNVLEDSNAKRDVFNLINFLCLFITGIVVVGLYFCLNQFITVWIGEKYLLDTFCIIIICTNFYLNCIMLPITAVKNSAGIYYVDRYISIIQAVINLIISIVCGLKFGIVGILFGTTISSIFTVNITKPYIIYKYVFKSSCMEYFLKILKNIAIIVSSIFISSYILNFLNINDGILKILTNGCISIFIYLSIFIAFSFRTTELNHCYKKIKRS